MHLTQRVDVPDSDTGFRSMVYNDTLEMASRVVHSEELYSHAQDFDALAYDNNK